MRVISERKALIHLAALSKKYREQIAAAFEYRAASCATCKTPGACCLDEHFVNVQISRLEAAAIRHTLDSLAESHRNSIYDRIHAAIEKYRLANPSSGDFSKTYACPWYEKGQGCRVHLSGKPVACITHACYESPADMPPDEVQFEQERRVDRLNDLAYGNDHQLLPLPLALARRD